MTRQNYRDEAARWRQESELVNDSEVRLQMLDLAAQYEQFARMVEAVRKASLQP